MSQLKSDMFIGKLMVWGFGKWSQTFPNSKNKPSYAWLKKIPNLKKGHFWPPQFFHLLKFWIQGPFLAQMKKNQSWQGFLMPLWGPGIFFLWKFAKNDFFGARSDCDPKNCIFTQNLLFCTMGKKLQSHFSQLIFGARKSFRPFS